MKIELNEILYAVSSGFDAVEQELLGVRNGHCKRIAALSIMLGKNLGLTPDELIDLAAFSILHDNALTEVNQEELEYKKYNNGEGYSAHDYNVRRCTIGERNTRFMPFRTNNRDVILLHHENADGSGPQGRTYDRTPVKSQIIHLADTLDNTYDLTSPSKETYGAIIYFVKANAGRMFSREISDTFCKTFKYKHLNSIAINHIDNYLRKATRHFNDEYSNQEVVNLATLIAQIVDYKSHYTCKHSTGVAEKCDAMATHYGFSDDKKTKYYLAGALHDIGKLMISNTILQKPAKLNGTGYPFGLTAEVLSHEERLMTCCDIYQALTEIRAYKEGFSHQKAISIMRDMAIKGEIDNNIVNAMDVEFGENINHEVMKTSILM